MHRQQHLEDKVAALSGIGVGIKEVQVLHQQAQLRVIQHLEVLLEHTRILDTADVGQRKRAQCRHKVLKRHTLDALDAVAMQGIHVVLVQGLACKVVDLESLVEAQYVQQRSKQPGPRQHGNISRHYPSSDRVSKDMEM